MTRVLIVSEVFVLDDGPTDDSAVTLEHPARLDSHTLVAKRANAEAYVALRHAGTAAVERSPLLEDRTLEARTRD